MPFHKGSKRLGQRCRLGSTALRAFRARRSQSNIALTVLLVLVPGLCWGQVDATSPQVVNFSFSPATLDLITDPTGPLMVHIEATDDLTGVVLATAGFLSPSGAQFQSVSTSLVSGSPASGTWEGSRQFPPFAESGEWTVVSLALFDQVGNGNIIDTAGLEARGFPTRLTVVSTPDTQGPELLSLSISPLNIDVSGGRAGVTFQLTVRDDISGGAFETFGFVLNVRSPSGGQTQYINDQQFSLVAGDLQEGTWEGTISIPQYSEAGAWRIAEVFLRDATNNQSFFSTSDLASLGFPTEFNVASVPADTTPPILRSITYSPAVINTSAGNEFVKVTMQIEDDRSGVDFSPTTPQLSHFDGGIRFFSPTRQQERTTAFFNAFTLVSGTPLAGFWEGTLIFPQFSEDGSWNVDLLQIKDGTRNFTVFDANSLRAAGLPAEIVVIRPSLQTDGTVGSEGGTVIDEAFVGRAQVTFPAGVLAEDTDVAIDVFADPPNIELPAGFQVPGSTHFVNINLDPEPVFPLPPPGLTVVLPLPSQGIPGASLQLFKLDATGDLVQAIGVNGLPVVGTVDSPGGQSATFTGIASLSTVVGLRRDGPSGQLALLAELVEGIVAAGRLKKVRGKVLTLTLKAAKKTLSRGQKAATILLVRAFQLQVGVLTRSRQLSAQDSQLLMQQANALILELRG